MSDQQANPQITALRQAFEDWYILNAFDLPINPIGSRECHLQWLAWMASRGLNSVGFPGSELGPHSRPKGPKAAIAAAPVAPKVAE